MTRSAKPLVTVLMPVYNGARFLRETINSILSQTYENFEFLIIDDGSTDETVDIIRSYDDNRIRLVKNDRNLKIVETLNKGILLSGGEYIARIDSDDIAFSNRLQVQVDYLETHPGVAVVAAVMEIFDDQGLSLNAIDAPMLSPAGLYHSLPRHNYISHPSIMARAEIMKRYLYSRIYFEDYDLWLRLANDRQGIHKINEALGKYRIHKGSIMGLSKSRTDNFKKVALTKRYYLRHLSFRKKLSWFNIQITLFMMKDYILYLYKELKNKLRG